MKLEKHILYITKEAKMDLEDEGYTTVPAVSGYPWNIVAIKESNPAEPVRCIQLKWTKTEKGAKLLKARYQHPTLPSGFQSYKHELWIWVERRGWLYKVA